MTLSYGAASTITYTAASATSVTPTMPSGYTTGNLLVIVIGTKPDTSTPSTPSGWSLAGTSAGGTGSQGASTGPVRCTVFYKVATSASETAPAITITSNNVSFAQSFYLTGTVGAFVLATAAGSDTTTGTGWSVTCSTNPGLTTNDFIFSIAVIGDDAATWSAEAATATGATISSLTEINEYTTGNGNDIGGFIARGTVTAGTSSANPVLTATAGGTTTGTQGVGMIVRIRETIPPVNAVTIGGSVGIGAPTVAAGSSATVNASTISVSVEVDAPTVALPVDIDASTIVGAATIADPTEAAGSTISASTISRSVTVAAPTVALPVTVNASTIGGTSTIAVPSIIAQDPNRVDATTISRTVFIPQPTISAVVSGGASTLTFTAGTAAESPGSNFVTSIDVTLPAAASGDYHLLVTASQSASGGWSTPAGWTALLPSTNSVSPSTSGHHAIYYRKWISGDPSTVTVSCGSGRVGVLPVLVSGADTTTFVEVSPSVTQAASGATSIVAPAVTSTDSVVMCYTLFARSSTATVITFTPAAGDTEVGEAGARTAAAAAGYVSFNTSTITAGVSSGTRTGTASSATQGAFAVSFVLKTGAEGPGTGANISPATISSAASIPVPTVETAAAIVNAATIARSVAITAPTTGAGAGPTPTVIAGVTTIAAPTEAAGASVTASNITGAATFPAPTVSASSGANVTPSSIARTVAVGSPTVSAGTGSTVNATSISRLVTIGAPTTFAGTGANVTPSAIAGATTIPASTTRAGATPTPAVIVGAATFPASTVNAGAGTNVTPSTISRTVAIGAPTISAGAGSTVNATTISRTVAIGSPTVNAGVSESASVTAGTISSVVSVGNAADLYPDNYPDPYTGIGFTVFAGSQSGLTPTTIVGTATTPAATRSAGANFVLAAAVAGVIGIGAATVSAPQVTTPPTIARTVAVGSPSVAAGGGVSVSATTVNGAVNFPSDTLGAGAGTTPATISRLVAVGTPVVGVSQGPVPATISRAVVVGVPTVAVSKTATPGTIARIVVVPAPTVSAPRNASATPATIQGLTTMFLNTAFDWAWDAQVAIYEADPVLVENPKADIVGNVTSSADIFDDLSTATTFQPLADIVGNTTKADIQTATIGAANIVQVSTTQADIVES
jgi:hypothetical protein